MTLRDSVMGLLFLSQAHDRRTHELQQFADHVNGAQLVRIDVQVNREQKGLPPPGSYRFWNVHVEYAAYVPYPLGRDHTTYQAVAEQVAQLGLYLDPPTEGVFLVFSTNGMRVTPLFVYDRSVTIRAYSSKDIWCL